MTLKIARLWGLLWVLPFNLLHNAGHWRTVLFRFLGSRRLGLLLHDRFERLALGFHPNVAIVLQHLL